MEANKKKWYWIGGAILLVLLLVGGYFLFFNKKSEETAGLSPLEEKVAKIRSTPEWLENLKKKAADRGEDLDERIRLEAQWCLDTGNC